MNADVASSNAQWTGQTRNNSQSSSQSNKISASPLTVVAGLLFLVPGTLESALVFEANQLAVGFAVVGTVLLLCGISNWVAEALASRNVVQGIAAFGFGLFLVIEFFAMMAFFAGFWMMHLFADVWPPAGTPEMPYNLSLILLVVMIVSSAVVFSGNLKYQRGDQAGFRFSVGLVVLLGLAFLGLRGYEYSHLLSLGFTSNSNAYGTCYYAITAFQALNVLAATGAFIAMLIPALSGKTNKTFVTASSIFWYFNTVACVFVVSQIYFWD